MILKFSDYFVHVLSYIAKNGETSLSELISDVPDMVGITPEERQLKSAKGTNIANSRIHWAVQYLFQAGALVRPSKGVYQITELGKSLLSAHPEGFTEDTLKDTEGYKHWLTRMGTTKTESEREYVSPPSGAAPQEVIESSLNEIEKNVRPELISRLQEMSPEFLEKSVLELLGKMGYGIDEDSLQHTGGPGDEGIDGIINQDRLGIQRIYVQAKRYKDGSNISRETIQSFIGAMQGATGGVFITTSAFTQGALDFASKHLTPKIVLIDGNELGKLLIRYEVGVVVKQIYKLVEIDENYFLE